MTLASALLMIEQLRSVAVGRCGDPARIGLTQPGRKQQRDRPSALGSHTVAMNLDPTTDLDSSQYVVRRNEQLISCPIDEAVRRGVVGVKASATFPNGRTPQTRPGTTGIKGSPGIAPPS